MSAKKLFWTDNNFEPKFSDRFVVEIKINKYIVRWYKIKSVDLPSFSVDTQTYPLLNRQIKFPTNIKWNPIKISVAETIDNDLLFYLRKHYEGHEEDKGHFLYKHNFYLDSTISKDVSFYNDMYIKQLDDDGNILETWEIQNFHITNLSFSPATYEEANIRTTDMTIEYEWAYLGLKSDGEDNRAKAPEYLPKKEETMTTQEKNVVEEQKPVEKPIPPPLDPADPPRTRKQLKEVEQKLQKSMGTDNLSKEKLRFPERRPIPPVSKINNSKGKEVKRGNLTPEGRRFISGK